MVFEFCKGHSEGSDFSIVPQLVGNWDDVNPTHPDAIASRGLDQLSNSFFSHHNIQYPLLLLNDIKRYMLVTFVFLRKDCRSQSNTTLTSETRNYLDKSNE